MDGGAIRHEPPPAGPASVCLINGASRSSCQSRAGSRSWGWARRISPSPGGTLARCLTTTGAGSGCRDPPLFQQFFSPVRGSARLHHADALHFRTRARPGDLTIWCCWICSARRQPLLFQAPLYQALASRLSGALIIMLPRTRLEQAQACDWQRRIGLTHVHDVPGYRNVILHATRQHGLWAGEHRQGEEPRSAGIASQPSGEARPACHPYICSQKVTGRR